MRRACLLLCLLTAGCGVSTPVTPDETYSHSIVVLDGSTHEWPEDAAMLVDEHYIYFRVSIPSAGHALQASPNTLAMWIDLDGSMETGLNRSSPAPATALGVDLEILFSPARPDGSPGHGVTINAVGASGLRTAMDHADVDFMFSPTYASTWYEGRISRKVEDIVGAGAGHVAAMFIVLDGGSPTNAYSDPFNAQKPARGAARAGAYAVAPAKDEHDLRVMSWNVLRDSPIENAAPFARVIEAVDPDVILLQEWDYSAPQLNGWFTALIDSPEWHALANDAWGVAIVSRYPLEAVGDQLEIDGREVRFVAGAVETPGGVIGVGSAHLKCCGGAGGEEDLRREAEARAINEALSAWLPASGAMTVVIGGDMNLVGSRTPLDALGAGLDLDGSDMAVAEAYVLGDSAQYTWREPGNAFTPGRLDYMLVGDSGAEVVRAFVLDAGRLSDDALVRMGLDRTDGGASDHLPLVVDLRLK